jgi:predicted dehydrogenase
MSSRRKFIQQLTAATAAATIPSITKANIETRVLALPTTTTNDTPLKVACIGMGIMGMRNCKTMLQLTGIQLVAVCDLYKGRLERAKELFGASIFTTQDYKEILSKKDIDAVIICTSDNWHFKISIDAMYAGKAVYCEKPVVHTLQQGLPLIKAQQQTGSIFQVGSQRVSNIAYAKAKELYKAGEIGTLNCIEASFDRHTALGAWQYTMPTDGSEETIAWKNFLQQNQNTSFDAKHFFWWRNYKQYGTGVAGDLFVHLLSGIHFITDSKGPSTIFASGNNSYWKDGRNVPDVMTGVLHYAKTKEHPAFDVLLKVNLASGGEKVEGGKVKFYGTEGVIDFGWNEFTVTRNKFSAAPNMGGWDALDTYPEKMQQQLKATYLEKFTEQQRTAATLAPIKYTAPDGFNDSLEHFKNFFESVQTKKPVVEDAVFGFRAAAPCLACNESFFSGKMIKWDGDKMRMV